MRGISLQQSGDDVSMALLSGLMERGVVLISSDVDLGIVLQQKTDHWQISEVRGHVYRPVAGLGFALNVGPVFYENGGHPNEVLLRAQMQRREPVLTDRKRGSIKLGSPPFRIRNTRVSKRKLSSGRRLDPKTRNINNVKYGKSGKIGKLQE